jgi:4-diphosphocytidyl-2-C-methyl-D-erythritol kinase
MVVERLRLKAPAKINLYLKITGQREDGYHELNTLMQKIALYDRLELEFMQEPGIHLSCPGSDLAVDDRNIVYRAARLFMERAGKTDQGIRIVLEKNIPVAAGLGGGSSNAASTLLGLDKLFATQIPGEELTAMGLLLGADVPFFIYQRAAALATGIGEKLTPAVPLAGYHVLLVNPGIIVSTKWAYETFALTSGENIFNLSSSQNEHDGGNADLTFCNTPFQLGQLSNDLETVTADKYSVISEIKQGLLDAGAAGSLMSGSGPTVFGLFADEAYRQAEQCCHEFKKEFDQVYLVASLV